MEMVYYYDGSFEGFLSCIFESYAKKEVLTAIYRDEDAVPTLFDCRTVVTDQDHASRVLRKLLKVSPDAAELVQKGFLTCMEDKELHLYHLVAKLLRDGPGFLRDLSDETLYPVASAVRHLNGEVHLLKGFVRFSELGGVLGSEIEPKNRVLPLLRTHFCARYREDAFFIYDRTHKEALFYAGGKAIIRPIEDFQMAPPDEQEANYRLLWKRFYDTIAIKE
ncbi:MAG: TIGR03915 family putative DNA repair protein, partial [Oscillibacter sp.]|nr:TIGR03915 family putative DNA repair protein [Oscillibacter sp.]